MSCATPQIAPHIVDCMISSFVPDIAVQTFHLDFILGQALSDVSCINKNYKAKNFDISHLVFYTYHHVFALCFDKIRPLNKPLLFSA